jgi:hypothetical protein
VADTETVELESLLSDQQVGALTQIFEEFKPEVTPDILERSCTRSTRL